MLLYTGVVTEYCMMSVAVTKVLFLCFAVGVTREGISPWGARGGWSRSAVYTGDGRNIILCYNWSFIRKDRRSAIVLLRFWRHGGYYYYCIMTMARSNRPFVEHCWTHVRKSFKAYFSFLGASEAVRVRRTYVSPCFFYCRVCHPTKYVQHELQRWSLLGPTFPERKRLRETETKRKPTGLQ